MAGITGAIPRATTDGLAQLAAYSAQIGADRSLIQGAGGNTSLKSNDGCALWIKASGTWLSAALEQDIFIGLDLPEVLARLDRRLPESAIAACTLEERRLGGKPLLPSIETSLHALMPHPVVVHVHSVNAIAFAVRTDGPALLSVRLDGLRWAWVPYARPGLPLTEAVRTVLPDRPDILVLANHGLVIGAADVATAKAALDEVERRLAVPGREAATVGDDVLGQLSRRSEGMYRPAQTAEAHWTAMDEASLAVAGGGALYPDHVVFLGGGPSVAVSPDEAPALIDRLVAGEAAARPPLILVAGTGTLLRNGASRGAEEMAACLGLVCSRLPPQAPLRYLTSEHERELIDWDAEKHRRSLDRPA